MLCRIRVVHIQPKKHVLDRAGCTAPTRRHERDIQIRNIFALKHLLVDHEEGIVSGVRNVVVDAAFRTFNRRQNQARG